MAAGSGKMRARPEGAGYKKKKAVPYNAYVARDRQDKFYTRKKTHAKFRRFQRYEERQEQQQVGAKTEGPKSRLASLLQRTFQEGPEAVEAEYERRLQLSFGDGSDLAAAEREAEKKTKKKKTKRRVEAAPEEKKKKRRVEAAPEGSSDNGAGRGDRGAAGVAGEPPTPLGKRKRKLQSLVSAADGGSEKRVGGARKEAEAIAAASVAAADVADQDRQRFPQKKRRRDIADSTDANHDSAPAATKQGKKAGRGGNKVPLRFAKAMSQYEEAQEAKAAEWRRRQEEDRERNRRRKEHSKNRAMKYELLSQKTARGQPQMQGRLDLMLSKLGLEANRHGGSSYGRPEVRARRANH